jgi:DNA helicase-2/ATP-dependent DNA helicase PcrA
MEQAYFVAQKIEEIRDDGTPLGEIAVLYRAHYHSMELQMELTRRGIPFQVRSGLRFFEQAHIKDVCAYLKVVCNPLDELAWKRMLQLYPKVGKATAEKIWRFISSGAPDPWGALDSKEILAKVPAGAREGWRALIKTIGQLRREGMTSDPTGMIEQVMRGGMKSTSRPSIPTLSPGPMTCGSWRHSPASTAPARTFSAILRCWPQSRGKPSRSKKGKE